VSLDDVISCVIRSLEVNPNFDRQLLTINEYQSNKIISIFTLHPHQVLCTIVLLSLTSKDEMFTTARNIKADYVPVINRRVL